MAKVKDLAIGSVVAIKQANGTLLICGTGPMHGYTSILISKADGIRLMEWLSEATA
jgi:hypothetical protein